jgi:hypothetical protein
MRRIMLVVTAAGRRLAADGGPLILKLVDQRGGANPLVSRPSGKGGNG